MRGVPRGNKVEIPAHIKYTQVFIDTLAAQRPNNLIKQEKV